MPKIYIELNKTIDFYIDIYEDAISQIFFQQLLNLKQTRGKNGLPVFNDLAKYNINYFIDLVHRARDIDAIDWTQYDIRPGAENFENNQKQFNLMHKDLEVLAGINKYGNLDLTQISLVDELHCCLHALEHANAPMDYEFHPRTIANFNYYVNYERTLMPEPVKFKRSVDPGEISLDYCYVGREPFSCWQTGDNSMLRQTCKIIDRIGASWKLYVMPWRVSRWGPDPWPKDVDAVLTEWYYEHKDDMDYLEYSLEKILNHTGFYTVGKITDISKLDFLRFTPIIEVTNYELVS